ncbi:TKL protein kinase [Saprolegnia diclina VS20]|uniref:TKL protein kinase n=1 Tax=Saprolegnia diclina (strain VS20) TaxID=1156394 RepID=T0RF34_SAPDV|nr:TKL protein kinase [Saprolegnia diclina VS20]EQC28272.1 TKL protein kinase [Saprolegnia diclina VS20]|eukprot:XP_008618276.1 TKL protein kinase [Saprolegnia diclina VS20]
MTTCVALRRGAFGLVRRRSSTIECLASDTNISACRRLPTLLRCEALQTPPPVAPWTTLACADEPFACAPLAHRDLVRRLDNATATPTITAAVTVVRPDSVSDQSCLPTIALGVALALACTLLLVLVRRRFLQTPVDTDSMVVLSTEKHRVELTPPILGSTAFAETLAVDMGDVVLYRIDTAKVTATATTLAAGEFTDIMLGAYQGSPVAIKRLSPTCKRDRTHIVLNLQHELLLHSTLESPYLVQVLGCTWVRRFDLALVKEFMAGGDLRSLYQRQRLDVPSQLCIAKDVALGLRHLHALSLRHARLSSSHVLVDLSGHAKLIGHGLDGSCDALLLGSERFRWVAPEVLHGDVVTEAADLYAFGTLLWEMDQHDAPFAAYQEAQGWTAAQMMEKVRRNRRLPLPFSATCPNTMRDVALQCMAFDPSDRMSALDVCIRLDSLS